MSIFILVQDGQILASYNLGNGPTSTVAPHYVTDGVEHSIRVEIKRNPQDNPINRLEETSSWKCIISIDEQETDNTPLENANVNQRFILINLKYIVFLVIRKIEIDVSICTNINLTLLIFRVRRL